MRHMVFTAQCVGITEPLPISTVLPEFTPLPDHMKDVARGSEDLQSDGLSGCVDDSVRNIGGDSTVTSEETFLSVYDEDGPF